MKVVIQWWHRKYNLGICRDSAGGVGRNTPDRPRTREIGKYINSEPLLRLGYQMVHPYHPPPPLPTTTSTTRQYNRTAVQLYHPTTTHHHISSTTVPPVGITEPTHRFLSIPTHRNYTTTNTFNTTIECTHTTQCWQTKCYQHTHITTSWMSPIPTHHDNTNSFLKKYMNCFYKMYNNESKKV